MGADHVARLSTRISGARVAVVNDYLTEKAEKLAAEIPGCRAISDPLDAIADPDVDAVVLATPGPTHEKQLLVCIEHDKPVLCEKPLTTDVGTSLDVVKRDLTELIARELKDPRVGMVTIQAVDVTPDYAHAKVLFSVLVGDPQECEVALNQAAGFLRNGLFKRLQIHTVPTLHFKFDRTTERAAELTALIAKANSTRAKDD